MNQPITTLCNVSLMGGKSKKKVEQRTHREIVLNLLSCSHAELHLSRILQTCATYLSDYTSKT